MVDVDFEYRFELVLVANWVGVKTSCQLGTFQRKS